MARRPRPPLACPIRAAAPYPPCRSSGGVHQLFAEAIAILLHYTAMRLSGELSAIGDRLAVDLGVLDAAARVLLLLGDPVAVALVRGLGAHAQRGADLSPGCASFAGGLPHRRAPDEG